jgi:transcription initiation factor IIF auxiliary subunit
MDKRKEHVMKLTINQELMKDEQNRIIFKVFRSGSREHYNIRIWLDGSEDDLDQVQEVVYVLHPNFRNRTRRAKDRSKKFEISIWTWGMFVIQTSINFKNGQIKEIKYYLSYELPPDTGENYVKT